SATAGPQASRPRCLRDLRDLQHHQSMGNWATILLSVRASEASVVARRRAILNGVPGGTGPVFFVARVGGSGGDMRRAAFAVPAVQLLGIALAIALPARAFATGFYINQQSVRGLGRVDAGNTVAADDLSTIFFNPAGLMEVARDRQRKEIQIE